MLNSRCLNWTGQAISFSPYLIFGLFSFIDEMVWGFFSYVRHCETVPHSYAILFWSVNRKLLKFIRFSIIYFFAIFHSVSSRYAMVKFFNYSGGWKVYNVELLCCENCMCMCAIPFALSIPYDFYYYLCELSTIVAFGLSLWHTHIQSLFSFSLSLSTLCDDNCDFITFYAYSV